MKLNSVLKNTCYINLEIKTIFDFLVAKIINWKQYSVVLIFKTLILNQWKWIFVSNYLEIECLFVIPWSKAELWLLY